MTGRFGLKDAAIAGICAVLSRYPQVEAAIMYGSRAKGNFKDGSDIDLTLRGGVDLTMQQLYRISEELDDLLLPYSFDLSILADITDRDLLDHIRRVGVTFYQRDPSRPEQTP